MLSKEYDPVTADFAFNLLESILTIAKWSVKGIAEEHATMREAGKRIREYERRKGDMDAIEVCHG